MSLSGSRSFLGRLFGARPGGVELADERAFLHARVTLYTKAIFVGFLVSTVVGGIKNFTLPADLYQGYAPRMRFTLIVFSVLTALTGGAFWVLRRGPQPTTVLHVIESAGTVLACAAVAAVTPFMPPGVAETGLLLIIVLALVARAGLVPSSHRRTVWVGLASTAILTVAVGLRNRGSGIDLGTYGKYMWAFVATFGLAFTIVTALVSRVIYGLHETVRETLRLGNYTLDRKLGEGGMGVVYLAHHALLRRPTALKLLPREKAGEHNVTRFEREVQQTSRLTHPNTVAIYDFGRTPDGTFYYVMEYLDGLDLRQTVELDGPMPPARVIYILAQVAHALAEAHEAGLVHRDIKPANVVLCDRGGVSDMAKVVDFGLVKDLATADPELSTADALTGTPHYIAPEALTAPDRIDGRTDLYALGALGYFLLTGKTVFEGASVVEVCGQHLHSEPVPPSKRLGRSLPEDLEAVLMRCLAKNPADRYADALELREALLQCRDSSDWGWAQAHAWWSSRKEAVRAFREDREQERAQGVGDADTLTADLASRGA